MMEIAMKPPPPGVKSDFSKKSPLFDLTIVISVVFLTLMYLFLGIRIYIRRVQSWKIDDTIAVLTAVTTTAFTGIVVASVQSLGRHGWDIPRRVFSSPHSQKSMVVQHILNASTLWLGKICIIAMYYRIFGHIRKVRWQLIITAVLALPLSASIIIRPVMIGPPIGKPWGTRSPWAKYTDIPGLMIGIDNIVVDTCLAYIPIPIVYKLNLSASRKRGILALFLTGTIAVVADIIILYYRIIVFVRDDGLLFCYIAHNLSLIECTISVILSSLPSFAKFWRIYIEPTAAMKSLCSRLKRSGLFESDKTSHHSLPTFIKEAGQQSPKRSKDPYSIGFATRTEILETYDGGEDAQGVKWIPKEGFDAQIIVVTREPGMGPNNHQELESYDLQLPLQYPDNSW